MNFLKKLFGEEQEMTQAGVEENFPKAKKYFEQAMSAEDNDLAIKLFQKAIDLNPLYATAYVGMAMAYYTKGNFEKASAEIKREYFTKSLEAAQKASNIPSRRMEDYHLKASLLIQANAFFLGDFETSLIAFENAINLDRHSQDAIKMLVNVWTRIKNAANHLIESREKEYKVAFPETTLTLKQVIDLLAKLKETEDVNVYVLRPEIEGLLVKLVELQSNSRF